MSRGELPVTSHYMNNFYRNTAYTPGKTQIIIIF
jgi:hypothetical protein